MLKILMQLWRYVVMAMLLIAAVGKIIHPEGSLSVLRWDGLSTQFSQVALVVLICAEVGIVILLLSQRWRVVIPAVLALFTMFTVQLTWLHTSRDAPPCSCFGLFAEMVESQMNSAAVGIARNVLVIISGTILYFMPAAVPKTSHFPSTDPSVSDATA